MTKEINIFKLIGTIGITLLLLATVLSSFYTIRAGEQGVLLTFGKASKENIDQGLHWKIPLGIQKVIKFETRIMKYETQASAASEDLQIVSSNIAVNYKLQETSVPQIYTEMGKAYEERIIQPAVQEVVKAIAATYRAEELITQRPAVKTDILLALKERLLPRGIEVVDISITNFDFSDSFNQAIEAKVTAEQLKLKADRDLERIQIEAKQIEAEAIGQRDANIARAEGEAQAIQIIDETLRQSPQYINWLTANKWDGTLPLATGQGAVPFINIQKEKPTELLK